MIAKNVITNAALEVGFDLVGVVRAEPLTEERNRFSEWLLSGRGSTLSYLERNVEKRFDPSLLVEGARSVIICAVSYLSPLGKEGYDASSVTKVASYAAARDYHLTIKEMLQQLAERLKLVCPELRFRAFTDSAPVAEKSLAVRAGFGWIGRNSLLITPSHGSMLLLGELFISCDVDAYDEPMQGVGCGSCRACIDHCPNRAILDDRSIDTRRCISCRTIEREQDDAVPLRGWVFGCDECQSVCPFNRHAPLHTNPRFDALFNPRELTASGWLEMSEEEFCAMAGATPMVRAGLARIKRNILFNEQE